MNKLFKLNIIIFILLFLIIPVFVKAGFFDDLTAFISKIFFTDASPTITFDIKAGWNLLSLPLEPNNVSVEEIFKPIMDKISFIDLIKPGGHKTYDPNRPFNDLQELHAGDGFWLKASKDATLVVTGQYTAEGIPETGLGWQTIGLKGENKLQAASVIDFKRIESLAALASQGMSSPGTNLFYPIDFIELEPSKGYELKIRDASAGCPVSSDYDISLETCQECLWKPAAGNCTKCNFEEEGSCEINNSDIQILLSHKKCPDGTPHGECSIDKPKYCDNGILINKASICGCPEGMMRDGENCIVKPIESCRGIICNGFCQTGSDVICDKDAMKIDLDFYYADPPDFTQGLEYAYQQIPQSIALDEEFTFTIFIKNNNSYSVNTTLDNVEFRELPSAEFYTGGMEFGCFARQEVNQSLVVPPRTTKTITLNGKFPDYGCLPATNRTYTSIMSAFFKFDDGGGSKVNSPFILIYGPDYETAVCGNKTYNTDNGACDQENQILYIGRNICLSNQDCVGNYICFDHKCINPGQPAPDFQFVKPESNIQAAFLMFYLDEETRESERPRRPEIEETIRQANEWWEDEIKYWQVENFSIHYKLSFCDQIDAAKIEEIIDSFEHNPSVNEVIWKTAEFCGIGINDYSIISFSMRGKTTPKIDEHFPSITSSGLSYGDVFSATPWSYNVLVHETMHAFGLADIYNEYGDGQHLQWHDCYLMTANSTPFRKDAYSPPSLAKHTNLCLLEAYWLGWIKPQCVCANWTDKGCGQGICAQNEKWFTRDCEDDCDIESECRIDSVCEDINKTNIIKRLRDQISKLLKEINKLIKQLRVQYK